MATIRQPILRSMARSIVAVGTMAIIAGALAGGFASVAMLALGMWSGSPTVAELIAEGISRLVPLEVLEGSVAAMGSSAKRVLFGSVIVGQIGVAAMLALLAERHAWSRSRFALVVVVGALFVGMVVLPLFGAGAFGAATRGGTGWTLASLACLGGSLLLGWTLLHRWLNPPGVFAEEDAAGRRALLGNGFFLVAGVALGGGALRWLADHLAPPAVPPVESAAVGRTNAALAANEDLLEALAAGVPGLAPEITPNERFYVVSKNVFRDPVVDPQGWQLEVVGLVDRPMVLTHDQMRALPGAEQVFTLQCISNEIGGELIGNARWRGIWLADLLRQSGVQADAVDVVFHAADDYSDSIPIATALQPGAMLAYAMNDEPLPANHGFPMRLLAPDLYGMKNVKWVTKLEVVPYDYKGYWQRQGWTDVANMHASARIDVPKPGSYLRVGRNYVGGVAVAGARGVHRVEVSTDGGQTWRDATVKPALGPLAWSLWLADWDFPADTPRARILARVTDSAGATQIALAQPTLPDGAMGYHSIEIRAAER